jgi:small subunit ribosomal protein S6
MEKVINSYEGMFIVSLADGEDAAKATVSKFNDLIAANAEVIKIDDWGKRRFAYPIQDMNEGYYTVVTFKCEGNFPAKLQRLMNIDESVLRAMVIRLEYDAAVKAAEVAAKEEAPVEAVEAVEAAEATDAE